MEEEIKYFCKFLHSVLTTGRNMTAVEIEKDYVELVDKKIPYGKYNCKGMDDFLTKYMKDHLMSSRTAQGQVVYYPKASESTYHLANLINATKTKSSKSKKATKGYYKGLHSYKPLSPNRHKKKHFSKSTFGYETSKATKLSSHSKNHQPSASQKTDPSKSSRSGGGDAKGPHQYASASSSRFCNKVYTYLNNDNFRNGAGYDDDDDDDEYEDFEIGVDLSNSELEKFSTGENWDVDAQINQQPNKEVKNQNLTKPQEPNISEPLEQQASSSSTKMVDENLKVTISCFGSSRKIDQGSMSPILISFKNDRDGNSTSRVITHCSKPKGLIGTINAEAVTDVIKGLANKPVYNPLLTQPKKPLLPLPPEYQLQNQQVLKPQQSQLPKQPQLSKPLQQQPLLSQPPPPQQSQIQLLEQQVQKLQLSHQQLQQLQKVKTSQQLLQQPLLQQQLLLRQQPPLQPQQQQSISTNLKTFSQQQQQQDAKRQHLPEDFQQKQQQQQQMLKLSQDHSIKSTSIQETPLEQLTAYLASQSTKSQQQQQQQLNTLQQQYLDNLLKQYQQYQTQKQAGNANDYQQILNQYIQYQQQLQQQQQQQPLQQIQQQPPLQQQQGFVQKHPSDQSQLLNEMCQQSMQTFQTFFNQQQQQLVKQQQQHLPQQQQQHLSHQLQQQQQQQHQQIQQQQYNQNMLENYQNRSPNQLNLISSSKTPPSIIPPTTSMHNISSYKHLSSQLNNNNNTLVSPQSYSNYFTPSKVSQIPLPQGTPPTYKEQPFYTSPPPQLSNHKASLCEPLVTIDHFQNPYERTTKTSTPQKESKLFTNNDHDGGGDFSGGSNHTTQFANQFSNVAASDDDATNYADTYSSASNAMIASHFESYKSNTYHATNTTSTFSNKANSILTHRALLDNLESAQQQQQQQQQQGYSNKPGSFTTAYQGVEKALGGGGMFNEDQGVGLGASIGRKGVHAYEKNEDASRKTVDKGLSVKTATFQLNTKNKAFVSNYNVFESSSGHSSATNSDKNNTILVPTTSYNNKSNILSLGNNNDISISATTNTNSNKTTPTQSPIDTQNRTLRSFHSSSVSSTLPPITQANPPINRSISLPADRELDAKLKACIPPHKGADAAPPSSSSSSPKKEGLEEMQQVLIESVSSVEHVSGLLLKTHQPVEFVLAGLVGLHIDVQFVGVTLTSRVFQAVFNQSYKGKMGAVLYRQHGEKVQNMNKLIIEEALSVSPIRITAGDNKRIKYTISQLFSIRWQSPGGVKERGIVNADVGDKNSQRSAADVPRQHSMKLATVHAVTEQASIWLDFKTLDLTHIRELANQAAPSQDHSPLRRTSSSSSPPTSQASSPPLTTTTSSSNKKTIQIMKEGAITRLLCVLHAFVDVKWPVEGVAKLKEWLASGIEVVVEVHGRRWSDGEGWVVLVDLRPLDGWIFVCHQLLDLPGLRFFKQTMQAEALQPGQEVLVTHIKSQTHLNAIPCKYLREFAQLISSMQAFYSDQELPEAIATWKGGKMVRRASEMDVPVTQVVLGDLYAVFMPEKEEGGCCWYRGSVIGKQATENRLLVHFVDTGFREFYSLADVNKSIRTLPDHYRLLPMLAFEMTLAGTMRSTQTEKELREKLLYRRFKYYASNSNESPAVVLRNTCHPDLESLVHYR